MSATTGVTQKQIEDAVQRWIDTDLPYRDHDSLQATASESVKPIRVRGIVDCARYLVPSTHVIIPRSYLTALTALLDAGDSRGISDGRAAAEHVWQDAENARDAAKEMGL